MKTGSSSGSALFFNGIGFGQKSKNMNEYTIDWVEKKTISGGKELIEATLAGIGDVTIWKLDKDGKEFPNFDGLAPGGKVTGNIWAHPTTGKKTLYPPKPAPPGGNFRRPAGPTREERKEDIKEAQGRKEESIAYFNAVNSAISIVSHIYELKGTPESTVKAALSSWIEHFLKLHQEYKDKPPF